MESRELTVHALYEESQFMDYQITLQYGLTQDKEIVEDIITSSPVRDIIYDIEYRLIGDIYINHSTMGTEKLTKGKLIGYEYFHSGGQHREITVNNPLFFSNDPEMFITSQEEACYLEVGFSKRFNINKDDTISITKEDTSYDLIVKEIINVPDYFMVIPEGSMFPDPGNLGILVVPMDIAQQILLSNNEVNTIQTNDILIRITSDADQMDVEDILKKSFEKHLIIVEVLEKDDNPVRNQMMEDIEGDKKLIGLFPLIIFTVSAIGLMIALRRMVQTHRSQIGIFKALGVPNVTIFLYFLTIGLIVAVAGIGIGYLLTFPLNQAFNSLLDQLFTVALYRQGGSLTYFVMSAIIAVILCIVCTLLPSLKAVREKPVDVIQKREGVGLKRAKKQTNRPLLSKKFPTPFKLISRDISRKPMRSITTIFGVALALAFFLSVVILADSMIVSLDMAKDANTWDYEISISGFVPTSISEHWTNETDTIDSITHGLRLPMNITKHDIHKEVLVIASSDITKSFHLGTDTFRNDGIYISEYLSNTFNVEHGDWIEVQLPSISNGAGLTMRTYHVEVLGIHSNPMGLFVYTDINHLSKLTNLEGLANVFYIHSYGRELPSDVQNMIAKTQSVSAVSFVSEQEKTLDEMFELMMSMIFMMIIISIILMTAIVYNISMINAAEKSREYATMKTLGTSLRRISYLIFLEGSVSLIGGIFLGSVGGYYLAIGMLKSTDVLEGFTMDIVFAPQWLVTGGIMVAFVVFSVSILTIRYIEKINIADVIRERSSG